jgi:hypothetical protein
MNPYTTPELAALKENVPRPQTEIANRFIKASSKRTLRCVRTMASPGALTYIGQVRAANSGLGSPVLLERFVGVRV